MNDLVFHSTVKDPYRGLRIVTSQFVSNVSITEDDLLIAAVTHNIIKYGISLNPSFGKFTLGYNIISSGVNISFIIGSSLVFRENNRDVSFQDELNRIITCKSEEYNNDTIITGFFLRIYYFHDNLSNSMALNIPFTEEEVKAYLSKMNDSDYDALQQPIEVKKINNRKRTYYSYITSLINNTKSMSPFIVADTETLLYNNIQTPYAIGLLVVKPGEDLSLKMNKNDIECFFSEDVILKQTFEERSIKILDSFIERIEALVNQNPSISNIYFHNFSRFDGIILLNNLVKYFGDIYRIRPLMRNNKLYQISLYKGKKRVLRLRDSLTLLPSSLSNLAKNLCPELGSKGSIPHDEINISNIKKKN